MIKQSIIVYWDSSAVLSVLFQDIHSEDALKWAKHEGLHLLSSLAAAEVTAVILRIHREQLISDTLAADAFSSLEAGPWRSLEYLPPRETFKKLSQRWPLRGADLWHLSTAITLRELLPELCFLTYDSRLKAAALGEGLLTIPCSESQ